MGNDNNLQPVFALVYTILTTVHIQKTSKHDYSQVLIVCSLGVLRPCSSYEF